MAQRLCVGFFILATAVYFLSGSEQLGYDIVSSNETGYTITAGGSLPFTCVGLLLLFFYVFVVQIKPRAEQGFQPTPMWVRAIAFITDFWVAFVMLSGLSSLVPLMIEAQRTGTFHWWFQRRYSVPTDSFLVVLVFVGMSALVMYFVLPLTRSGHTIGSWLFRLAVVGSGESQIALPVRLAFRRVYREVVGALHPCRTFKTRDAQGWTWYDRETGVTVMRY